MTNLVNHIDSNNIITSESSSFQTDNMIHKINKIHKKRKRNYKNIEEFDVLKNDMHVDKETEKETQKEAQKETFKEGLMTNTGIGEFRHDEFTGYDVDYEHGKQPDNFVKDPRKWLIDYIKFLKSEFIRNENNFSDLVTKFLSGTDYKKEDHLVIVNYINWFFSIILSTFFVYNWYYLVFYSYGETNEKPTDFLKFTDEELREMFDGNGIFDVVYFFAEYSFNILSWANWFIIKVPHMITSCIPAKLNYLKNPIVFTLLFYYIIHYLYNNLSSLVDTFVDIIGIDINFFYSNSFWSNWLVVLTLIYSVFLSVYGLYKCIVKYEKLLEIIMTSTFINIFLAPLIFVACVLFVVFYSFITPILFIIMFTVYLIVYSFYGISLYENYNIIQDSINEILHFIKSVKKSSFCDPSPINIGEEIESAYYKIKHLCVLFLDVFLIYIFQSAFIFMLIYGTIDYSYNIKSVTLKSSLIHINMIFILITMIYEYLDYTKNGDNEETVADRIKCNGSEPADQPPIEANETEVDQETNEEVIKPESEIKSNDNIDDVSNTSNQNETS